MLTAYDIVRRADEVARGINSVKYHVRSQRIDVPESLSSSSEGTVIMEGWTGSEPKKFRFDVRSRLNPESDPVHITVGSDGNEFWAMNHRDKTAQVGVNLESLGGYRLTVKYFPVYEFVLPNPFGDELQASKVELAGLTEVNGEPCYAINIVYRNESQGAVWYFSTKDFLPRRVDRFLEDPEEATLARASFISDLAVKPQHDEDPYAFRPPDGYTVDDKRGD